MAEQNTASATELKVKVGGTEVPADELISFSADLDLGQPDQCLVTVRNDNHKWTPKAKLGDPVEVAVGESATKVFIGEVVGFEAFYRADGESKLVLRAFNKLHRLLRGRKSRTYLEQTDKDIVGAIAGEHGLSPKCGSAASIKHEHIYQHNQCDLEFLRLRAARLGFTVWVEDKTLYFDAPALDKDSGIKLRYGDAGSTDGEIFVKSVTTRVSSASVVDEVTVRGWNPEKKEEIVGKVTASSSKLGKTAAHSATSSAFSKTVTYEVDFPIFSVEEAKAIAEAKLEEANMGYLTAELQCRGNPELKPGIVVTVTVNVDKEDDPFNGKYLVTGANHSYANVRAGDSGGYISSVRLARNAHGG